jgi:protoporphyrin/coproporphyrin ferrochelatase
MISEPSDALFQTDTLETLPPHDAILIVGFGGPEGPDDVLPFLENVTRGRGVPRARLLEVAEHYDHFGGVSPLNGQIRELISALRRELARHGIALPIYWGNRNWRPLLADTMAQMTTEGSKRALAVVLAAYSAYSSCRQYREDIAQARTTAGPGAPQVDKLRVFYNHPEFITANAERVSEALREFSTDRRDAVDIAFTAHSIPAGMARNCDYEFQLGEACRLVAQAAGVDTARWRLVFQSRSGRPGDPWLEPDILEYPKELKTRGSGSVLIHPIGFLSDHMEVLYDLDHEARILCAALELNMVRSRTVGTHPSFVSMLRELIAERVDPASQPRNRAVGRCGPSHDVCPEGCCLPALVARSGE